jgi:hypothetical protein
MAEPATPEQQTPVPGNTRYPYWPDYTDAEGDALSAWFDDTCGDCIEGRCHWGGDRSRQSTAAAAEGREYEDPTFGRCGCARHSTSVVARPYQRGDPKATALAWQEAKDAGEVVVVDNDD